MNEKKQVNVFLRDRIQKKWLKITGPESTLEIMRNALCSTVIQRLNVYIISYILLL